VLVGEGRGSFRDVSKAAHGPAVRFAQHEATHGAFFDPNRSRPERSTGLGQKRDGDIAFGVFRL
jgi:hypothetical protein